MIPRSQLDPPKTHLTKMGKLSSSIASLMSWFMLVFIVMGYLSQGVAFAADPVISPLWQNVEGVGLSLQEQDRVSDITTIRHRFIHVETGLLNTKVQASQNDKILLNLFDGTSFVATLDRIEKLSRGGIAWIGHLNGIQQSEVILITRSEQMAGNIVLPGAFYQVRYAKKGIHVLREIDQSKFPPEAHPIPVEPNKFELPTTGNESIDKNLVTNADDGSVIDVLVVYTPDAKDIVGGQTAMQNLIDLAITESNVGYGNSQVTQRLNLVHTAEVAYDETDFDWDETLSRLKSTTDGYMDNVHTLRDNHAADEVVLIVKDAANQNCGLAFTMTTVSHSFESSAFAVARYSCATGYYSFAHELGLP
ncbi:peptidyl-Asp metalloendopeptidase [Candidatus Thiomargarita nelsonii]|uniref:Peptidyl-Asp metalloendopeptidase n=1 Tax=Candidatus Thiomargarita nelsonii TaxID=1003181 RepID=A0A176S4T2_9GAMM|nr:peptidyl-Asp metalloendopeptidase [Candidatus Thiomargarita nelsonii]